MALAFLTLFMKFLSNSRRLIIFFLEFSAAIYIGAARFYYVYKDFADPGMWPWVRTAKFLDYFFALIVIWCFSFYLKDMLKKEGGLDKAPAILFVSDVIVVLGLITLIVSRFTDLYYYWDAGNVYTHSKLYPLCFIAPMGTMLVQLACIIRHYRRLTLRMRLPLLLFLLVPISMAVMQFVTSGLATAAISTVGMAVVLYVFAVQDMNDSIEHAHKIEIEMMATYQKELQETVAQRTQELKVANEKAEHLLLNILPEKIAHELAEHPDKTISKRYPNATVLFTDIVEFTKLSSNMTPEETVTMLNMMTTLFDDRARRLGIEKIKTIGDSYMAACGLTEDETDDGAEQMLRFAKGILEDVREVSCAIGFPLKVRIGINSGELVAGVIGKTKFIYDVWGDTVNIASRMESTAEPMTIHVSEATYNRLKANHSYKEKSQVQVKGKGLMDSYIM